MCRSSRRRPTICERKAHRASIAGFRQSFRDRRTVGTFFLSLSADFISNAVSILRTLVVLALFLSCLVLSAAETESDALIREALKPSPLENNLRRLTDEIGGRVPGTPAFQRAVDWSVAAFKEAGADS